MTQPKTWGKVNDERGPIPAEPGRCESERCPGKGNLSWPVLPGGVGIRSFIGWRNRRRNRSHQDPRTVSGGWTALPRTASRWRHQTARAPRSDASRGRVRGSAPPGGSLGPCLPPWPPESGRLGLLSSPRSPKRRLLAFPRRGHLGRQHICEPLSSEPRSRWGALDSCPGHDPQRGGAKDHRPCPLLLKPHVLPSSCQGQKC